MRRFPDAAAGPGRILVLAGCLLALASAPSLAQRGITPSPNLSQLGAPSQAEARTILDRFRATGLDGDYYLEFELRVMPRRGEERLEKGRMWGGRTPGGELTRIILGSGAAEQRLLVLSGPRPAVWRHQPETGTTALPGNALLDPLAGTELTAFDLLRPFVYWDNASFEAIMSVRSRPSYRYLLRPPETASTDPRAPAAVRIYLDTAYNALVQTEMLTAAGLVQRSMLVQGLKKIGDRWIVKTVDLRNELTGDRTRFSVTAAAVGLDLSDALFTPAQLGAGILAPEGIVRVDP